MAQETIAALGSIAEQRWGLVTTEQAQEAGVSRQQLSRWASNGVLERVAQGVYRMAGAPPQEYESIYATWLALGGATRPAPVRGVSTVVAAGVTAATVHRMGDFFLGELDFIVPARKATRLPGVRLRVKQLTRDEVLPVNGLPTLTVERTISDLVEQWNDLSLVAGVARDALLAGRLISPQTLVSYLEPLARRHGHYDSGHDLAQHLFELAGLFPERWAA